MSHSNIMNQIDLNNILIFPLLNETIKYLSTFTHYSLHTGAENSSMNNYIFNNIHDMH